jgi:pimeloyl-ACP methyl ester carboxylesterase
MTCATSAAQVEDLVIAAKKIDSGSPIFLAGHSRGGAIVIAAARRLQAHSISVDAMFLFDAVDRSIAISHTDVIPANVRVAYHALRAPAVGSRTYFGNCGTKSSFSGQMESEHFYSTHAGIGGTPWTGDHPTRMVPDPKRGTGKAPAFRQEPTITKSQDEAGSRRVHGWMWERLARHNVINA